MPESPATNEDSIVEAPTSYLVARGEEDLETGSPQFSHNTRSKFRELPEDLVDILGGADKVFNSEEELERVLAENQLSDCPIVLDDEGKACLYMPGDDHNIATGHITLRFNEWADRKKGCALENHNLPLGPRRTGGPPPRKRVSRKKRLPDVSFWGQARCTIRHNRNGHYLEPQRVNPAFKVPKVHPHVVVQINIGNDEDYEVDTINDIMNRADTAQGSAPNRGILIKSRAADATNGMQAGWDVYSIPRGATFQDAVNNTNQAHHVVYNYGGADVDLVITEADLGGFKFDFWGTVRNFFARSNRNTNFSISLAELYDVAV